MDCTAGHLQLPYEDIHNGTSVDYYWHSRVPNSFFNVEYTLYGSCTFPVQVDGRPGGAVLTFKFDYILESLE